MRDCVEGDSDVWEPLGKEGRRGEGVFGMEDILLFCWWCGDGCFGLELWTSLFEEIEFGV